MLDIFILIYLFQLLKIQTNYLIWHTQLYLYCWYFSSISLFRSFEYLESDGDAKPEARETFLSLALQGWIASLVCFVMFCNVLQSSRAMLQQTYLSKHETLTRCWSTVCRFYLQTGRIHIPNYFNHLYHRKTNTTHHPSQNINLHCLRDIRSDAENRGHWHRESLTAKRLEYS